jgi:hypothetical protein
MVEFINRILREANDSLIQYSKDVRHDSWKIVGDILNVLWRLYSGAGIAIAGIYISCGVSDIFAKFMPSLGVLNNTYLGEIILVTLISSPAVIGLAFGVSQMWYGKSLAELFNIDIDKNEEGEK